MRADAASLVDALPLPAVLIDGAERIVAANARAEGLLGPRIAGRHFITALRQPAMLDAIEGALRDRAARSTRYLTSDEGQDATFKVSVGPVALESGHGVLVVFEDMTHLEQAGQMRRDFVANVSHELRTPLTALMGFIETLSGPARDDAAARARFLSIMEAEARRMNRLVMDLLSLSRVEADERVRPRDPVDLVALVRSTLHGLQPLVAASGAVVRAELPEAGLRVPGDEDQLRQVLNNLLENAIKYGGAAPEVAVTLTGPAFAPRLRGPAVRLAVRDGGPGIDPIHVPRLTERFYRIDTHRSRAMGGTGLGLAIVKHIVNRHRGRLEIDSVPGQGATFTIVLPVD